MEQIFHMDQGRLTCRQQGDQVAVTMTLRPTTPGLYRGILCGKNGRVDLGTLLPEGEGLRLSRTFSADQLRRRGCWPITGGKGELRYPFGQSPQPKGWQQRTDLTGLFSHRVLAESVGQTALFRQETDGFSLAFPWDPKAPFPLVPAFCFGRVEVISGRAWLVFSFRAGGWPAAAPSCQTEDSGVQYL